MAVEQKRRKSHKGIVLITLMALTLIIALLLLRCSSDTEDTPTLVPDYAPENSEPYAEVIPDDTSESTGSNNGGSVTLNFSDSVVVDLSDKTVSLFFANPKRSNQDLVLQIIVKETVIAQSELIPAGYQVEKLDLVPGVSDQLQTGGYDAAFMVHYYDQENKERAFVNTNIPIRIEVKQ